MIRDEIAPRLIGEDAFAIERCWELARPATFNILRDRRIALVACAAVDGAIWDAAGKALGQPVWRLWVGYRNTIGVIWTGGYYTADIPIEVEMAFPTERYPSLSRGDAAVYIQNLASDKVRCRRREKQHRPHHILRLRDAAQRYA